MTAATGTAGGSSVLSARRLVVLTAAIACAAFAADAAEKPVKLFAKEWEGRRVLLKRSLYSLAFDEVGKLGATWHGKAEGLTVVTPTSGTFYRFPGRQSQQDIVDADPNRLVDQVRTRYERTLHLEIGTVSSVSPVNLIQYAPGVELIVRSVQVDRVRVRLALHNPETDAGDLATSLTVQWPSPLSSAFTERSMIEALILQYVELLPRQTAVGQRTSTSSTLAPPR
jgi:hypothetical protein